MAERPTRVQQMKRYLDEHAAEIDGCVRSLAIDFGEDGSFTVKLTRIDRVKAPERPVPKATMD